MGIMQIFTLLGALGMFLYGMNLMSSGLQKAAGDRLRGFLSAMTSFFSLLSIAFAVKYPSKLNIILLVCAIFAMSFWTRFEKPLIMSHMGKTNVFTE